MTTDALDFWQRIYPSCWVKTSCTTRSWTSSFPCRKSKFYQLCKISESYNHVIFFLGRTIKESCSYFSRRWLPSRFSFGQSLWWCWWRSRRTSTNWSWRRYCLPIVQISKCCLPAKWPADAFVATAVTNLVLPSFCIVWGEKGFGTRSVNKLLAHFSECYFLDWSRFEKKLIIRCFRRHLSSIHRNTINNCILFHFKVVCKHKEGTRRHDERKNCQNGT